MASGRLFNIQKLPYSGSEARFSCSISKKVASKATERNRVRRRVRAAFRDVAKGPGLFVIVIKKPALLAAYDELREELKLAYSKIQ